MEVNKNLKPLLSSKDGASAASLSEEAFSLWKKNPGSVSSTWDALFRKITSTCVKKINDERERSSSSSLSKTSISEVVNPGRLVDQHILLQHVVRSYQVRGHLVADLDPLGIPSLESSRHSFFSGNSSSTQSPGDAAQKDGQLSPSRSKHVGARSWRNGPRGMPPERIFNHLSSRNLADLDQKFRLPEITFVGKSDEKMLSLRDIIRRLDEAYCRHIGVEYMYITSHEKLQFIRRHFEPSSARQVSKEVRRRTLFRLARATDFESFLASKWSSERRFGIEGCEALIPAVQQIIDRASQAGVEMVVIGAPHRGRLNLLANVCEKPMRQIFLHFTSAEPTATGTGDLKYHLGTVGTHHCVASGRKITVCVMATPSHLEAGDPVVQGRTRAEQVLHRDPKGDKVMSIMLHGDAAFCGQGVVYETFHLSQLPSYTTHGSVHIVIDNQVGYTTDPRFSRSSPYCTDVARVVNAPILHVNADYPDAVTHCCNVAVEYRMRFRDDVVIDLVGYRRNGHNEADEPMFTQPLMYKLIRQHEPVLPKYLRMLIAEQVVTPEEVQRFRNQFRRQCDHEYEISRKETSFSWSDWLDSPWKGFFKHDPTLQLVRRSTGVAEEALMHVAMRVSSPPPQHLQFELHPGVEELLSARLALVQRRLVDWPLAEMFAFGSLLREGVRVRLSGQDVERGVFSQRHHVLHHQSIDKMRYIPLQHLYPLGQQAPYEVCNSSLSEYGVMGFEVGYAMASPHWLIIWESQFGDFTNTAQCVIDQFLSSGESKWTRQCGLVCLCPHGLEGMGPEHSSSHLERFLSLSSDDPDALPNMNDPLLPMKQLRDINWILANCSTPANYFHILRRQLALPFRKPLVIFTPKGGLMRSPEMVSPFRDFTEGTEFITVISDDGPAHFHPENVRRHILCSGKIYYDFMIARRERSLEINIALTRIEQLCPFPYQLIKREIDRYPSAELCWGQEEHKNHGAWNYVLQRMGTLLTDTNRDSLTYIGRDTSPSPAAGSRTVHRREHERLIQEAMTLTPVGTQRSNRLSIVRSIISSPIP